MVQWAPRRDALAEFLPRDEGIGGNADLRLCELERLPRRAAIATAAVAYAIVRLVLLLPNRGLTGGV